MNIPKITILEDDGYHPKKIMEELQTIYPKITSKIKFDQPPTNKAVLIARTDNRMICFIDLLPNVNID